MMALAEKKGNKGSKITGNPHISGPKNLNYQNLLFALEFQKSFDVLKAKQKKSRQISRAQVKQCRKWKDKTGSIKFNETNDPVRNLSFYPKFNKKWISLLYSFRYLELESRREKRQKSLVAVMIQLLES